MAKTKEGDKDTKAAVSKLKAETEMKAKEAKLETAMAKEKAKAAKEETKAKKAAVSKLKAETEMKAKVEIVKQTAIITKISQTRLEIASKIKEIDQYMIMVKAQIETLIPLLVQAGTSPGCKTLIESIDKMMEDASIKVQFMTEKQEELASDTQNYINKADKNHKSLIKKNAPEELQVAAEHVFINAQLAVREMNITNQQQTRSSNKATRTINTWNENAWVRNR